MNADYKKGFFEGVQFALNNMDSMPAFAEKFELKVPSTKSRSAGRRKPRRSSKAKLLDKMTKPKWNKYKKGRGKKTYVQIRAEVSRSQAYKRAVKRL